VWAPAITGGPSSSTSLRRPARSLGIPALTGIPESVYELKEGTSLALDGFTGRLWIMPGDEVRSEIAARRAAWLDQKQRLLETVHGLAITLDGQAIEVAANVGGLVEAQVASQNGADAIGVLRTEFLFLRRSTPPDEQTQVDVMASIFDIMGARPVCTHPRCWRDKLLPYTTCRRGQSLLGRARFACRSADQICCGSSCARPARRVLGRRKSCSP
jgi:phosphoenolpyruvate-protein kinase (PTS system EI component)